MTRIAEMAPRVTARVAAVFYVLNFVTGSLALAYGRTDAGPILNLLASASYAAVTLLFYRLFKPVSGSLSLLAALVGLAGCAVSAFASVSGVHPLVHPLTFFGVYCLLIGYLIFRSTFLPHVLGVLLAIGGLGWLTFAWPSLARQWSPYNMAPGIVTEAALTLWLLVAGVNHQAWNDQACRRASPRLQQASSNRT